MAKHERREQRRNDVPMTLNLSASADESKVSPGTGADDLSAGTNAWRRRWRRHWWAVGIIALLSLGAFGAGLKYLEDTARQERAANGGKSSFDKSESSLLSKVNPFVEPPLPTATPQLSKSYIYAGSRMLAVEDANAVAAPPADLAVWRESTGYWYVLGGTGSQPTAFQWGGSGDTTVPGDYDGDGKTDFSVFRPAGGTGTWYVNNSSNGNTTALSYGAAGDRLAQADYDGDGKTDFAVFRNQSPNGYWYLTLSSTQSSITYQFGLGGDTPAPADYDGDGKADLAVWRESTHSFYYAPSSGGAPRTIVLSNVSGTEAVSADYDGDGKADAAIKNGSVWNIKQSSDNQLTAINWQPAVGSQRAVQNDYDGDGKVDIAVWSNDGGNWYIRQSSRLGQANELRQVQWGAAGDIPVPAFYRR